MDRRRLAVLAAIAVAGFASLATSPAQPTPPPSIDETTTGSVHLTADVPVAVRELRVRVPQNGEGGQAPTVTFTQTALLTFSGGEGDVRLSIVLAKAPDRPDAFSSFRSVMETKPRSWMLTCDEDACEGTVGLLVEWIDPAQGETADVDWSVKAHIDVWSGAAAGLPKVQFTTAEVEPDVEASLTSAAASGDAVRLDVDNRLAQWRVSMRLGDDPLEAPPGWPVIIYARLTPKSTVVNAPAEGREPGPLVFVEGADELSSGGRDATMPGDSIEFEPFWACLATEPCAADYTIGLFSADSRPDVAMDASWNLDVRAIGVDGQTFPVTIVAEPIPPMPMISATIRGTYITGSEGSTGASGYTVTERPRVAGRDDQWDGLRTPTYGIFRATMTSTGSAPLPTDGFGVHFGPRDVSPRMELGQEVVYAFSPGGSDCGRVPDCDLSGAFTSGIGHRAGTLKPGWQVTIEWELELGMGTTAIGGDSELSIEAIPIASPSP